MDENSKTQKSVAVAGGGGGMLFFSYFSGSKKYGNFYTFLKDEFNCLLYVTWLGYSGACFLILIKLTQPTCEEGGTLEPMLPTNLDNAPYCGDIEEIKKLSWYDYLCTNKSHFPYGLRSGMPSVDIYVSFFTGMLAFLISTIRFSIKTSSHYLNKYINWEPIQGISPADTFSFYILPTFIYYVIGFLPVIFIVINCISCYKQEHAKFAYLVALVGIVNIFVYPKGGNFITRFLCYILYIIVGCMFTFWLLPTIVFAMSSVGWFYIYAFFKLLPFFFVYGAGMTWKEFIKQILKEISGHARGLCILFLYFSTKIAYKNLDEKIALGYYIASMCIILYLLLTSVGPVSNAMNNIGK